MKPRPLGKRVHNGISKTLGIITILKHNGISNTLGIKCINKYEQSSHCACSRTLQCFNKRPPSRRRQADTHFALSTVPHSLVSRILSTFQLAPTRSFGGEGPKGIIFPAEKPRPYVGLQEMPDLASAEHLSTATQPMRTPKNGSRFRNHSHATNAP